MAKQYKVLVNGGAADKAIDTIDVMQLAGDRGQAVRIKATPGAQYQLQEVGRGQNLAPDYVKAKRKGNSLEITFEKGNSPDLIIEDYYDVMPKGHVGLIGQAENGSLYEFIPENPSIQGLVPTLMEGAQPTVVALGGSGVALIELAGLPLVAAAFPTGLLGAGAAVAAAGLAGGGGGGGSTPADTTIAAVQKVLVDIDGNNDGFISKQEQGSATTTSLTVTFDPAKAAAGDVLTITAGGVSKSVTLTADDVKAGKVTSPGWPLPAEGATLTATASLKDAAGNTGAPGSDSAQLDTTAPNNKQALGLTIDADSDNDGFINASEQGSAATTSLTATFDKTKVLAGDTVRFTVGSTVKAAVLTQADVDAGQVTSSGWSIPADGSTLKATAVLTDAAGNSTPEATDIAIVDTSVLSGIAIVITTDANDNKLIGQPELSATGNTIKADITLPANAKAGDVLLVTGTGNSPQSITLSATDIGSGHVGVDFTPTANGTLFVASATVSDAAGNTSATVTDQATINTQAAGAPTVTVLEDANNDSYINAGEVVGTIQVKVQAPTDAAVGDQLIVTKPDGTTQTFTLDATTLASGVTFDYPAPAADGALTFSAVHKNAAGNLSEPGSDSATLDRSNLQTGLGITITTDGDNNELISQSELTSSGSKVAVKVTLAPGAAAGDTLTITGSGNTDQTVTLSAADISNGYVTATFNPTADNTTFVATASLKDAAGNTGGPVQDQATMRVSSPGAPTVVIVEDGSPADGYINASELNGNIDVEYILPATAAAGDTLVITKPDGMVENVLLSASDISAGTISRSYTAPADGGTLTTSALIKDAAGNLSASSSDSARLDTTVPNNNQALGLTIDIDNNIPGGDGFITSAEKLSASTTSLSATFDKTKVFVGDLITFTVGSTVRTVELTQAMIDAGKVTSSGWPLPAEGATLTATATLKDAAGNTTPLATDTAKLDTTAPNNNQALGLTIDADADNDGYINSTENGSGTTGLSVTFDKTQVSVGDVVTLTVGNVVKTVKLTQDMVDKGTVTSADWALPADGATMTATATLTDAAGNTTPEAQDTANVDTSDFGDLGIEIKTDSMYLEGFIGQDELAKSENLINVSIDLPKDAKVGDVLLITGTGNSPQLVTLTADDLSKSTYTTTFIPPANGIRFTASAQVIDAAGNSAIKTDIATIETEVGGPIVTILSDKGNDGQLMKGELTGNVIQVAIKAPPGAIAGETIIVSLPDKAEQTFILESASNGGVKTILIDYSVPSVDGPLTFSAVHKSAGGNTSRAVGTDTVTLDRSDLSPGLALAITTDADTPAGDGVITAAELAGTDNKVAVKVTLPDGAHAGDTLTIEASGNVPQTIVLTADQVTTGFVTANFMPTSDQTTFQVVARVQDVAGNQSVEVSDSATMDTTVSAAPVIKNTAAYFSGYDFSLDESSLATSPDLVFSRFDGLQAAANSLTLEPVLVFANELRPILGTLPEPVSDGLMGVLGGEATLDFSGLQTLASDLAQALPSDLGVGSESLSLSHLLDLSPVNALASLDAGLAILDKAIHQANESDGLPQWSLPMDLASVDATPVYALFNAQLANDAQQLIDQALMSAALTL